MTVSPQKIMLKPFSVENAPDECKINALISNVSSGLKVAFILAVKLADLIIPRFEPSKAQRKDRLWEHTCFEIFLGPDDSLNYWEFNFSPSGDWNVYSFSGYREGMKPEKFFDSLPFEVKFLSDHMIKLEVVINLEFIQDCSDLNVGLSAVIEQNDGSKSYWAMCHPKDIPDFHAREGWLRIILTHNFNLSIVSC